jgi:hypothetical protein
VVVYIRESQPLRRRIKVQSQPGKKQDPIWKVTKAKKAGGVAQVLELLPSKCEALSSNPSTAPSPKKELKLWVKALFWLYSPLTAWLLTLLPSAGPGTLGLREYLCNWISPRGQGPAGDSQLQAAGLSYLQRFWPSTSFSGLL